MKCKKLIVMTGYRVQFVDLREPKPRAPREEIHVADRQWLGAMGLIGHNVADAIRGQYEKNGYKVFSVEPIKPKRVAEIDLCKLWEQSAPPINAEETTMESEVIPG